MYLNLHGLREKPFNLTPDPRFIFLSKNHREAFAHLLYGINNRSGFIVLTGEVGSGKTTVLRALLSQLDADNHRTALIFNPCLSPPELLQTINREFGISTLPSDNSSLLDALNQFLLQQNAEGRMVVLAIDEAQNLEAKVLEEIRLISNLETDREKLIQIVLSGQPEFMQVLKRNEMRQLNQRITVHYHLQPLDFEDMGHYITHRLAVAGGKAGIIFSPRALKKIYRYSKGLPRLINAACDRILLASYTRDATQINARIAAAGIKDVKRITVPANQKRRLIMIPALAILGVILAAGIYFLQPDFLHRFMFAQHFDTTEKRMKKISDGIVQDRTPAMADKLVQVPESENAGRAFNNLAGFWNVLPLANSGRLNRSGEMERAAFDRGLRLYRFSGNLGTLLRLDYPAALELRMPGMSGKRFVLLVGKENDQIRIDPLIAGGMALSFGELERYWSGQAFLLWKDYLNFLTSMSPGAKGAQVKRLQGLLREAGVYRKPLTGLYDSDTISAVKVIQSSSGIEQDGIVGGQTLMHLYRSIDRFKVPRLSVGRK